MYADDGTWGRESFSSSSLFICQLASPALRGKEKLDLIYKKDQLTFRSFHVWYNFKAASQQVLDSWEDKRMTGFKLTWRIERPSSDIEAIPAFNDYEKISHTWLVKMVQLAQYLRVKEDLTEERILDKVFTNPKSNGLTTMLTTFFDCQCCSTPQFFLI